MDILISGGSGFLGSAFSKALIKRYQEKNEPLHITWLTRDSNQVHPDAISMLNYDELATTDRSFDVIVNLAGAGIADERWSETRKQALLASRIKPTESLLTFIERSSVKPKLLVSGSAIGWYGAQGDLPLTETSTAEDDFAHHLCETWEQLALQATEFGVPVAIVRTGVVIHPDGGMLAKLLTPFKMGAGGQLGDGQQIMSWISRDDWVGAVIFIIEQHLSGADKAQPRMHSTYNLTAPNPVTNRTFTKALGTWLHRPTFLTLPSPVLKLMFGEMSTLLIDGQKVVPQALQTAGYEFKFPTLEQALTQQTV